jgi:peptidoglycan/LPS O-acetylase OafA/YrhL
MWLILGGVAAAWTFAIFVPQMRIVAAALPFTLLIANGAISDINDARSMFRGRSVVLLGTWSYAFYLVHYLILRVAYGAGLGRDWGDAALWVPVLLTVCIGAAGVLTTLVEIPAEKRFRPRRAPRIGAAEPGLAQGLGDAS